MLKQTTTWTSLPHDEKTSCLTCLFSLLFKAVIAARGLTLLLCHNKKERKGVESEGAALEEVRGGRADGAPRARNVNWQDCFNKVLILVDAGRRLACRATQSESQLAVRYCELLKKNFTATKKDISK